MLVIDCGPLGPSYQPGHGHCDCLSYEFALGGERIVVDTGVHDYDSGPQRRYTRSTAAHNTVTIDGAEQSEIWGVFRAGRRAVPINPSLTAVSSVEASFTGSHDGYLRRGAMHRRTVRYARGIWFFEDVIEGDGLHRIQSRIHLRPGLAARIKDGDVAVYGSDGTLKATFSRFSAPFEIETAVVHQTFGTSEMSDVIIISIDALLPATIGYAIVPARIESATLQSAAMRRE
jgi:uncharacterized heparinase superfamily protein